MPTLMQPALAPRSVDMVRVIRRSMRCFVFGCIGFIPILGLGLAAQAMYLLRSVFAELNHPWHPPPVYYLWVLAVPTLWYVDELLGFAGCAVILGGLMAGQSYWLWKQFPREPTELWNPAREHLFWGMALGYAGILNSLAVVTIFVARLSSADW